MSGILYFFFFFFFFCCQLWAVKASWLIKSYHKSPELIIELDIPKTLGKNVYLLLGMCHQFLLLIEINVLHFVFSQSQRHHTWTHNEVSSLQYNYFTNFTSILVRPELFNILRITHKDFKNGCFFKGLGWSRPNFRDLKVPRPRQDRDFSYIRDQDQGSETRDLQKMVLRPITLASPWNSWTDPGSYKSTSLDCQYRLIRCMLTLSCYRRWI